ncbi:Hypothetical protein A7982_08228 [Minicystis rosea]|nr:Hypothetical protein A7982_08228 [Minicystis rosea]
MSLVLGTLGLLSGCESSVIPTGSGGSTTGSGGAMPTGCPPTPEGGWSAENPNNLPSGSCVVGSTCEIGLVRQCPDGSTVPGTHYGCTCETGSWQCDINGGLNFVPCPDAGAADGG